MTNQESHVRECLGREFQNIELFSVYPGSDCSPVRCKSKKYTKSNPGKPLDRVESEIKFSDEIGSYRHRYPTSCRFVVVLVPV